MCSDSNQIYKNSVDTDMDMCSILKCGYIYEYLCCDNHHQIIRVVAKTSRNLP